VPFQNLSLSVRVENQDEDAQPPPQAVEIAFCRQSLNDPEEEQRHMESLLEVDEFWQDSRHL
jgi:hypothetical protein